MNTHTMSAYDDELNSIKKDIKKMTTIIEKQLKDALKVLFNQDAALAREVHEQDEKVNILRGKIERKIVNIFALRQPMANDLRWLVSTLQISSELERIGDYADNISKRTEILQDMPEELINITRKLEEMINLVITMFKEVIESFVNDDKELATKTWKDDKKINSLYKKIHKLYISFMIDESDYIEMTTKLLFVVKTVERIGDRVTNIAEKVFYTITGDYLN